MTNEQALATWLEIKKTLRNRLGKQQWDLWIREARLLWLLGGELLLIAVPRSGRKIYAAQGHLKTMRHLAADHDLALSLTVYPDDYDWIRLIERTPYLDRRSFLEPENALDPENEQTADAGGSNTNEKSFPSVGGVERQKAGVNF